MAQSARAIVAMDVARVALGLGRRLPVYPLAHSLSVDARAGDKDKAPEALLQREGLEEVARAV